MKIVQKPERQASLISQLIDRKIETKVSYLESQMMRVLRIVKAVREATSPARMQALEKDIAHLKSILEDFNLKSLEEDIFRKLGSMNRTVEAALSEQKKEIGRTEERLASLKDTLSLVRKTEEKFESFEPKQLRQQIESLKTKVQWMELEMEKVNVTGLLDRIDELESRLDALRISQPTIIE